MKNDHTCLVQLNILSDGKKLKYLNNISPTSFCENIFAIKKKMFVLNEGINLLMASAHAQMFSKGIVF